MSSPPITPQPWKSLLREAARRLGVTFVGTLIALALTLTWNTARSTALFSVAAELTNAVDAAPLMRGDAAPEISRVDVDWRELVAELTDGAEELELEENEARRGSGHTAVLAPSWASVAADRLTAPSTSVGRHTSRWPRAIDGRLDGCGTSGRGPPRA